MQIEIKLEGHCYTAEINDTSERGDCGTKVYDFELESLTDDDDNAEMSDQFVSDNKHEIDMQIESAMESADNPY